MGLFVSVIFLLLLLYSVYGHIDAIHDQHPKFPSYKNNNIHLTLERQYPIQRLFNSFSEIGTSKHVQRKRDKKKCGCSHQLAVNDMALVYLDDEKCTPRRFLVSLKPLGVGAHAEVSSFLME
jgi:hypothetical protein